MFDLAKTLNQLFYTKKLEENVFKNFKEHMLFNVWTQCLSRKIKTTQKENKKKILKVENIVTKWNFCWIDLTAYWWRQEKTQQT